jgi:hypothetical protein
MRINSETGHWPSLIIICVVKGCKQQSWKDLQARHQQIRNRLSAAQVRIIGRGENRHDLGHVPQLFHRARVASRVAAKEETLADVAEKRSA